MSRQILWQPSTATVQSAGITSFMKVATGKSGRSLQDYKALHAWSLERPNEFWSILWDYCQVISSVRGERVLVNPERMPGASWFPETRLNFAENLLRTHDETDALVFWGEDRVKRRMSHAELHQAVARLATALRAHGVGQGDRVAAYIPNMPEAVVAMLATASIGAVFASASPDFGVQGFLDRLEQIAPKVLIAADGYYYKGKAIDVRDKVAEVAARLPSLERTLIVPYVMDKPAIDTIPGAEAYDDFVAPYAHETDIRFCQVPFDHPLYIVFSSGTTGIPKCIVHSVGGTLLQHLKEHRLHTDVHHGDRLFFYTTCGWMMWNWLVSGLASGATLLLYDGSPFASKGDILFDYAEAEGATQFGVSAKYIEGIAKLGLIPRDTHRLDRLRTVLSTGSPLLPEGFDYVYEKIKPDVCLSSISGGTDILSCFVLGCPVLPVRRGEIQCRGLGMSVEVWNEFGQSVQDEKGELVCTAPFPSMPIGFWNDPDGTKYRAAYFERYPNVWCHGDYAELVLDEGMIIYGRSDAVLNPGGVRIGTAEIYRQVDCLPEVEESVVIGQIWPPEESTDVRVVLFVRLRQSMVLDQALANRIKRQIRDNATSRHVPAKIVQVSDIPRTRSGKLVELAVRDVVHGRTVKNIDALANPESLEHFRDRPELMS